MPNFHRTFVLLLFVGVFLVACSSQSLPGATSTLPASLVTPAVPPITSPISLVTQTATPIPTASPTPVLLPENQVSTLFVNLTNSIPANQGYGYIQPEALNTSLASVDKPFLLDVRDPDELNNSGYIDGAVNIPLRNLLKNLDKLPSQDANIVIYSNAGYRSGMALAALILLGYKNVHDVAGGFDSWVDVSHYPAITGNEPPAPAVLTPNPVISDRNIYSMLDSYLSNLPSDFYQIEPSTLSEQLVSSKPPVVVDMNNPQERAKYGYIKGSLNIPYDEFFTNIDRLPSKDTPIVIYSIGGGHSSILIMGLRELGYTNVFNLDDGILGWKNGNFPVETGGSN